MKTRISIAKGPGGAAFASLAMLFLALSAPAVAQEDSADAAPGLSLSLNTVAPVEAGGCRLTFVIRNNLGGPLDKLVLETVLFDTDGRVATLTLFDFGQLPAGRPRVRQFDVGALPCDGIGEVLINGVNSCEGEGLEDGACLKALRLSSGTDIEVSG